MENLVFKKDGTPHEMSVCIKGEQVLAMINVQLRVYNITETNCKLSAGLYGEEYGFHIFGKSMTHKIYKTKGGRSYILRYNKKVMLDEFTTLDGQDITFDDYMKKIKIRDREPIKFRLVCRGDLHSSIYKTNATKEDVENAVIEMKEERSRDNEWDCDEVMVIDILRKYGFYVEMIDDNVIDIEF